MNLTFFKIIISVDELTPLNNFLSPWTHPVLVCSLFPSDGVKMLDIPTAAAGGIRVCGTVLDDSCLVPMVGKAPLPEEEAEEEQVELALNWKTAPGTVATVDVKSILGGRVGSNVCA